MLKHAPLYSLTLNLYCKEWNLYFSSQVFEYWKIWMVEMPSQHGPSRDTVTSLDSQNSWRQLLGLETLATDA
jgi:hypothetical protein